MSALPVPESQPNPFAIFEGLTAFQRSAALRSAIELDLFTHVGQGSNTVPSLADATGASPRGVRILCDFMVTQGLLEKHGARYGLTPDAAAFLDRRSPSYLGGTAYFLQSPTLVAAFADLTSTVRRGTTNLPGTGTATVEHPVWVEFARSMSAMMLPAAEEIANMVAPEAPARVLDIAAGHGLFGILVAARCPETRVTALDSGPVLSVARENAARWGVADRWSALEGDAFEVEYGTGYDLILVTNFFHHFDPPACERVMRKIHAALKPGGHCMTLEFVPNEDRVSPPTEAAFALVMLATTAAGDAFTHDEYSRMFENAGFASTGMRRLTYSPQSVLIAAR